MAFRVGDEVKCVRPCGKLPGFAYPDIMPMPEVGLCYTVKGVGHAHGAPGLFLHEIGWTCIGGSEGMYRASNFRKVERKSDSLSIEAFRTIKDGAYEEPRRTNQPAKRKEQA